MILYEHFLNRHKSIPSNQVLEGIDFYLKYRNKFPNTDILSLTWEEFTKLKDQVFCKLYIKQSDNRILPIYKKDKIKVYLADTRAKCIHLGQKSHFCISKPDTSNDFPSYRFGKGMEACTFYFINYPYTEYTKRRTVIQAKKDGTFRYTIDDESSDNDVTYEEILTIIPHIKYIPKEIFQYIHISKIEEEIVNTKIESDNIIEIIKNKYDLEYLFTYAANHLFNKEQVIKIKEYGLTDILITNIKEMNDNFFILEYLSDRDRKQTEDYLIAKYKKRYYNEGLRRLSCFVSLDRNIIKYAIDGRYEIVDGLMNVYGHVNMKSCNLYKVPFKFGKVTGGFDISDNKNLDSLEDSPYEVDGFYDCSYCGILNLEHSPYYIGHDFYASGNKKLNTLENSPQMVMGKYCAAFCDLYDISDLPPVIEDDLILSGNYNLKRIDNIQIEGDLAIKDKMNIEIGDNVKIFGNILK